MPSLLTVSEIAKTVSKARSPKGLALVLPYYADALEEVGEPSKGWRAILTRGLFPYRYSLYRPLGASYPTAHKYDYNWFVENLALSLGARTGLSYKKHSEVTRVELEAMRLVGGWIRPF